MRFNVRVFLSTMVLGLATSGALAVPYASGITDLGGGDYSFVLNQDADQVVISRIGDTPLALGPLTRGTYTFNLGAGSGFEIAVFLSEEPGWAQISDDALTQCQFYSPKGVTVDTRPASPYFGMIYVGEAAGGTTGTGRTTTDGIYVLTADFTDILAQGDTAFDGGIDWTTSSSSPLRISLNQTDPTDTTLFIGDWSDGHSGIWAADTANMDAAFNELLDNTGRDGTGLVMADYGTSSDELHGSVSCGPWVEGSGDDRAMFTIDEDVRLGYILQYDIGTTTSGYATAPTDRTSDGTDPNSGGTILNGYNDLVRDEDGSWWIAQYRWTDSDAVCALSHWEDFGTDPIWRSGPSTVPLDRGYGSLDLHNESDQIVVGTNNSLIYVLDVSDPAAPALTASIDHAGANVRDVAFDIAGNIYAVSNSSETLRVYSPGGDSLTVTTSDGVFMKLCFGDLDDDGAIGLSDLAALLANYGMTSGAVYLDGDLDFDGDVDLSDLAALLAVYGTSCP